jgi:hypothetical protein
MMEPTIAPEKTTRILPVDLTPVEINRYARQLATGTKRYEGLEVEKKALVARLTAQLKELRAANDDLAHRVTTGKEDRVVDCVVIHNLTNKQIETRRCDNWELVECKAMSSSLYASLIDRTQQELDIDGEDEETQEAPPAAPEDDSLICPVHDVCRSTYCTPEYCHAVGEKEDPDALEALEEPEAPTHAVVVAAEPAPEPTEVVCPTCQGRGEFVYPPSNGVEAIGFTNTPKPCYRCAGTGNLSKEKLLPLEATSQSEETEATPALEPVPFQPGDRVLVKNRFDDNARPALVESQMNQSVYVRYEDGEEPRAEWRFSESIRLRPAEESGGKKKRGKEKELATV